MVAVLFRRVVGLLCAMSLALALLLGVLWSLTAGPNVLTAAGRMQLHDYQVDSSQGRLVLLVRRWPPSAKEKLAE